MKQLKELKFEELTLEQKLGMVHIEISEGSGEKLGQLREQITQLEKALYIAVSKKKPEQKELNAPEALSIAEEIISLDEERNALQGEQIALNTELEKFRSWGDFDPDSISPLVEKGIDISFYEIPKAEYNNLGESVKTVKLEQTKSSVKCLFVKTGAEGEDLALPLRISSLSAEMSEGMALRFTMVDPVNVSPGDYNATNPLQPDYMQPKCWWVLGQKVHASRMISVFDNPPPLLLRPSYNFLGIPQAQILWDYVLHWNECRIYTADLLKKISLLVMQTDTQAIFGTPGGVQSFDIRMQALQRYRDNNSVFVCDKQDEQVSNVQTSTAGCTDIVRQSLEMIAAINRTPAVKLLGISPSGFNATGESDLKNYYDHIRTKQEILRPAVEECLKAIEIAEAGTIDPSITFEFKQLGTDNDSARAMNAQTRINTLGAALDRQVISPEEMRAAVKADPDMGLDFIDDEMPDMGDGQDMQTDTPDASGLESMMAGQQERQEKAEADAKAKAAPGHEDGMKQAMAEKAEAPEAEA